MATCNARGGDLDIISKLPDSILHQILSFLDMTCVIQTCILSKRWRYIWASLPFLNFDVNASNKWFQHQYQLFPFFVHRILIFRDQKSNIETFRVSYDKRDSRISSHIFTWMHLLIRNNVQVIDLHLQNPLLPNCLFTWKSLTTLKLDMGVNMNFFLPHDLVVCLPALKTLHLKSLTLESSIEKLILKCPVLETLIIYNCHAYGGDELTICNAQLKRLVVGRMLATIHGNKYLKFNLSVPNLKSFSSIYHDLHHINHYSFVNVPSLDNAEIDVKYLYYDYFTASNSTERELLKRKKEDYIVNVVESLREIYNVKSLKLSVWLLELVTKVRQSVQINPFCNLSLLQLKTSFSILQICAIKYFLEICPNLETLVLKVIKFPSPKFNSKVKYWEPDQLPPQCMMHHLKVVEIWDAVESVNELEFLKLLLKNATFLEKMIVLTSNQQLANNTYKRFTGFREKLISFCGASSSIEIVFM